MEQYVHDPKLVYVESNALAYGPSNIILQYTACKVWGYKFYTMDLECNQKIKNKIPWLMGSRQWLGIDT